jgi:hypothetical protein
MLGKLLRIHQRLPIKFTLKTESKSHNDHLNSKSMLQPCVCMMILVSSSRHMTSNLHMCVVGICVTMSQREISAMERSWKLKLAAIIISRAPTACSHYGTHINCYQSTPDEDDAPAPSQVSVNAPRLSQQRQEERNRAGRASQQKVGIVQFAVNHDGPVSCDQGLRPDNRENHDTSS